MKSLPTFHEKPADKESSLQKQSLLRILVAFVLGCVAANVFNGIFTTEVGKHVAPSKHVEPINTDTRFRCKVVIFVPSAIPWARRRFFVNRQFASEQWAADEVQLFWVVGTKTGPQLEETLNPSSIFHEPYMDHNNVLLTSCRDYGDEMNNPNGTSATTCKFYEAMRYIHKHYRADYVIRGADDAYLNTRYFLSIAHEFPTERLWLGQQRTPTGSNGDLDLSNQPQLQKLFGMRHLSQNYMLGMGSIFTADIADLGGGWNIPPHLTWCEDVLVGTWLTLFAIQRVNRPDLFINRAGSSANTWPIDGTYGNLTTILVHYIEPEDWDHIYNNEGGKIYVRCKGKHCP